MKQWATNLQQNTFNGIENVSIVHASMIQMVDSPAMILVSGRSESYLKYQDVANYYYALGYSVYMLDHRGQGLSERLTGDTEKGHIIDFCHYIEDLAKFVDTIVIPNEHTRLLMLGHSMGGAIVTRYLQTKSHPIERVVLASPMLGIILPAPKPLIKLVAHGFMLRDRLFKRSPSYVIGGHGYEEKPFDDNDLTQSLARYQAFVDIYRRWPQIQLGSPTNLWLLQSLAACELCVKEANKIAIPVLLLQAGSDTIVDNSASDDFCTSSNSDLISKLRFDDARHELLFEQECIRQPVLDAINHFLEPQC